MRLDRELLDRAVKALGASSRSEAIDMLLRQVVAANKPLKPSKSKIESPITPA
jgi:metal-responsive CopG/Arc/MetJ family transcriptional regulator